MFADTKYVAGSIVKKKSKNNIPQEQEMNNNNNIYNQKTCIVCDSCFTINGIYGKEKLNDRRNTQKKKAAN